MTITGTPRPPAPRRPSPPPDATTAARLKLREFALFLAEQDPVALAQAARDIDGTLIVCDRMQLWLQAYEEALQRRTR